MKPVIFVTVAALLVTAGCGGKGDSGQVDGRSEAASETAPVSALPAGELLEKVKTAIAEKSPGEARKHLSALSYSHANSTELQQATALVEANDARIDAELAEIRRVNEENATAWTYSDSTDEMGRTNKVAYVQSSNSVNFGFPYNKEQRATLIARNHSQHGKDIILKLEKAHFLCGYDGCSVMVRFDDAKPVRFSAGDPADHSTNTLFIEGYTRFVTLAKKAKVVRVEAGFYQEGSRIFEFPARNFSPP